MHEPKAAAATFPEDELAQLGVNSVDRAGIQRRTLRTLMGGIVPGGAAMSSAYSSAAILGEELTSNQLFGGIAASGLTTGAAITAIPLARVMARRGRRVGIAGGYAIAGIGAFACLLAAQIGWYPLLVLGMLSVGMGYASNMAARFASADLADEPGSAIGMLIGALRLSVGPWPVARIWSTPILGHWGGVARTGRSLPLVNPSLWPRCTGSSPFSEAGPTRGRWRSRERRGT
ncbi:MAG: hypothetical protein CM1200mP26_25630 [Acidimicrobiales bacterium]|nr:MAG: hypothetical protein CM1200mP26_25630 [Acidimicrobiales bacterium]